MCDLDEKRENQEIWFNTVHLVEMAFFFFWPDLTMYALNIH